jgi:hypothetical protein
MRRYSNSECTGSSPSVSAYAADVYLLPAQWRFSNARSIKVP